jgi:hypothetical protein
MPTDGNKQWISDKLICTQMFVSWGNIELQKTPEQHGEDPRLESRDLESGPFSATNLLWE